MNATLSYWFLNVATSNLRMSRGTNLLLDRNPKVYEGAENISTKVEVNLRILSTLKSEKYIWSMYPGGKLETSMVWPLVILSDLVKRKIGPGSSKSGRNVRRHFISHFLAISFRVIKSRKKWLWISWDRFCFNRAHIVGTKIFLFLWGLTLKVYIWR